MPPVRTAAGLLLLLALCLPAGAGSSGDTNAALKRINKATKGLRGVVAEVEYSEILGERSIEGAGKLYVHEAGILRADIGGDEPRTLLFSPPLLYVHRYADKQVDLYDVTSNPDRLGQYVTVGFVPNGTALKKHFQVHLVEDGGSVDGKPALNFLLTPDRKKAPYMAGAIARIQLWVDPQSGLPVRQEIVHVSGFARLHVRYVSASREDELADSLFRPDWPDGVTIVRE